MKEKLKTSHQKQKNTDQTRIIFSRFEHTIWKLLEKEGLTGSSLLIAASGGMDSIVLLEVLATLRQILDIRLAVAYIHHGHSGFNDSTQEYRQKAFKIVQEQSRNRNLEFFSNCTEEGLAPDLKLSSEEDLRKYRYSMLESIMTINSFNFLALGHHQEDLLETRLIRFIRGTGPEGLEAMAIVKNKRLRPLLNFNRSDLQKYALQKKLTWLEDPSNEDLDPLRNWVRKDWLPQLEAKRPGSRSAFARSLELISNALSLASDSIPLLPSGPLDRRLFIELSASQKRQSVARYLRRVGARNYTLAHVDEIIKRLDTPRKNLTFTVARCLWKVNAEQISAYPIGQR